jgi:hypothetical protein
MDTEINRKGRTGLMDGRSYTSQCQLRLQQFLLLSRSTGLCVVQYRGVSGQFSTFDGQLAAVQRSHDRPFSLL